MENLRIWRALLALVFLLVAAPSAFAQCVEFGGKQFCGPVQPKPWSYGACDEHGANLLSIQQWCAIRGGTWNGSNSTCVGDSPDEEGNLIPRSNAFANWFSGSACSLSNDTGWHANFSSNFCTSFGDNYASGWLQATYRQLTFSCRSGTSQEKVTLSKRRDFECPAGYTVTRHPANGSDMCTRPIEACANCIGNPITPGTGTKIHSEMDYRHALGLEFQRHYHSFRFYEPNIIFVAGDAHTESRMGTVWRTNFDRRILASNPRGISLPNGEVQYFNAAGAEVYNYGGGGGTLVTVAGVGFFYKGTDRTEFFGTDGRLRSISLASGQVFTLFYSDGTGGPNGGFVLDANGQPTPAVLRANTLIRVSDAYGNTLSFGYDGDDRLVLMTAPGGAAYHYAYDRDRNLTSVTYPDARTRTYRYNEPANMVGGANLRHALTSIVDENGDVFSTFRYDTSGRALSTEHAGGVQRYELTYNSSGTTTVTDPLSTARTMGFPTVDGLVRLSGNSLPGGGGFGAGVKQRTHDAAGNVISETNFNDVKTCYAYLAGRNLETVRVEGVPAAANCSSLVTAGASLPAGSRKVATEWHARWRLPIRVAEPLRRTTFAYNGDGGSCAPASAAINEGGANPVPLPLRCSVSVQPTTDTDGAQGFSAAAVGGARTSSFTYSASGQVLSADGPRIDVADITSYAYDPAGNVSAITNAAGHLTSITSYNAHGQPLTIVDANGLTTSMTYDARQRLTSRSVGTETTSYDYDPAGQLTKVTLPDGSYLSYGYDAAHRLTGISDNQGNAITYTLDAMGNRIAEEVRDPGGALAQARSRVYSSLNRLFQELGAQSQTTEYAYDDHGNVTSVKDPLNKVTVNQYDALNRLKQVTDPGLGVTQYGYNGLNALISVSDPRNLVTGYTVNGLGNLTQQQSPDTGTTTSTYDDAGNLLTQTDAKGQVTTYVYDALNRVTQITFHDGSRQLYAYDAGANGIGRLGSITELDASNQQINRTSYVYDQRGRVLAIGTEHAGVIYNLGYAYDSAGRLVGMTYPSGRALAYSFDSLGRVSQVDTTKGGQTLTVVSGVAYHPFGGVKGYVLGNGQAYSRSIDLDGRIASYTLGSKIFAIGYDAASRITFISDVANPANTNTYFYDAVDRLTGAVTPGVPYAYNYDAVGNRTSKTVGSSTNAYTYSSTSNRIATVGNRNFTFDANGSTTNDGVNSYAYDARGRMVQATSVIGPTSYRVNALGQRIRKTNSQTDTVFHYDTNGKLIAETDPAGGLKREIIYLGDIPVGVVQ